MPADLSSLLFEVAGLVMLFVGLVLWWPPAAFIVTGLLLLAAGVLR